MLTGKTRTTIYIAGPMTGYEDFNFPLFDKIAMEWDDRGFAVLNPASAFMRRQDLSYNQYMRSALMLLLQADCIALLPRWRESDGACMEALAAARLGLPFFDAVTGKTIETPKFDVTVAEGPKLPSSLSDTHRAILLSIQQSIGLCPNYPCKICGMTCDDIEAALKLSHSTASARLWELHRLGYLVRSSFERPTRSGMPAHPYLLTAKGKEALRG